jgi:putative membrane protein
LPRLYVYHTQIAPGGDESARFMKMERLLLRAIMNPAMIATWLLGLILVLTPGIVSWTSGWWHLKLLSVLAMTGFHGMLSKARREFAADGRVHTERYWRIMNEVPTLLMIIIVIMVIVKPF